MKKFEHYYNGETLIHYDHPLNDVALCGLSMEGDDVNGDGSDAWTTMHPTHKKVNCVDCLTIVAHVRKKK